MMQLINWVKSRNNAKNPFSDQLCEPLATLLSRAPGQALSKGALYIAGRNNNEVFDFKLVLKHPSDETYSDDQMIRLPRNIRGKAY